MRVGRTFRSPFALALTAVWFLAGCQALPHPVPLDGPELARPTIAQRSRRAGPVMALVPADKSLEPLPASSRVHRAMTGPARLVSLRDTSRGEPFRDDAHFSSDILRTSNFELGTSCSDDLSEPGCARPISVREDVRRLFPDLWDDTKSIVNCGNGLILGAGLSGSLALRDDVDGDVRRYVAEHPERWGKADDALKLAGDPVLQVPVMFSVYGYSVWAQDEEFHSCMRSMIHAHAITSLATVAVKGIADTDRPSDEFLDGRWGFPSYHTASSVAIAATIEEYYGFKASVPWYVLAGLISWSRIDQQEHDLSDVTFGAVMGYVIGHSVAARHQQREHGWELRPWYGTRGTNGLMLEVPF